jgi:hypothetical protein
MMEKVNQEEVSPLQQRIYRGVERFIHLYKSILEMSPYVKSVSTSLPKLQEARKAIDDSMAEKFKALAPTNVTGRSVRQVMPISTSKIETHVPVPVINGLADQHVESVEVLPTPKMEAGVFVEDVNKKIPVEKFHEYIRVIEAVEIAVQAVIQVAKTWEDVEKQVESMMVALIQQMGKEVEADRRKEAFYRKTYEVSKCATRRSEMDIKVSIYQLVNDKWCVKDLVSVSGKVESVNQKTQHVMDAWIQDISGILMVVVDEATSQAKFTTNVDWIRMKDQVKHMIQSMVDVQRTWMDRRPYTEVAAIGESIRSDSEYYYRPAYIEKIVSVIRVSVAFSKMEEKMDQVKKEAFALAEALQEIPVLNKA